MITTEPQRYRLCPNCGSERPEIEWTCQNQVDGEKCLWPLADQPVMLSSSESTGQVDMDASRSTDRRCANGHSMSLDMEICFVCGADPAQDAPILDGAMAELEADALTEGPPASLLMTGYSDISALPGESGQPFESFRATELSSSRTVLLTLYAEGAEPDGDVYQALRRMPRDHVPDLIATGRHEGRAYDAFEFIEGGSLAEAGYLGANDVDVLQSLVAELAGVLSSFEDAGLRHRDLNPHTVMIRGQNPLDLVVTRFGSARLSDFDLESVAPLELTRYSSPEAIVGAVSAASDWWSLGMIILEQATAGQCFEGTNDQAFRLHVVTRGVDIPPSIQPRIRLLLRGLLARDPHVRWSSKDVRLWLRDEYVPAPDSDRPAFGPGNGTAIFLGGRDYERADLFALAAAEPGNWDEAQQMILNGRVGTWLSEAQIEGKIQARFRRAVSNEGIASDFRQSLALMAMNPDLPMTIRGEIVSPGWLLAHPDEGYSIVTGEVGRQLESFEKAAWIVGLASRAEAVRDRAKMLEIELDESRVRVALLSTSRPNLDAEREALRNVYPDTDHAGLASILERPRLSDEELIILVSASTQQYVSLEALVKSAAELATRISVPFDPEAARAMFVRPRRELFSMIDERTANFARCGIDAIDEWVDMFRVERRMSLARTAILLSIPAAKWQEPPKQQYVANLLTHFEKRVTGTVSRGPLARFGIGKTTPRLDLVEMGTALRPAESILNHLIGRTDAPVQLDPLAYAGDDNRESRLRRLVSHAQTFRRDTGFDGRTLGFPFLVIREARSATSEPEARPRVAPVLLWPVVLEFPVGSPAATIAFDKEREEVRLNPALETMLPPNDLLRWKAARDELLSRGVIKYSDVIDVFGSLAEPRSRTLGKLIPRDTKVPIGTFQLLPAAALFNAEFAGQAIAEDLRQMVRMPPAGTGLEATLRISNGPAAAPDTVGGSEIDRFLVAPADPSQEAAVVMSRSAPGLLVEGPPGTGKSQSIVNVITDAIGRHETVLVICQKQAALKVVQKRLDAEGLGDRLFLVVDINKDREIIIRSIKDQREKIRSAPEGRLSALLRQREEKIARIERLEGEIDSAHGALYRKDDACGLSYREVLSQLIGIEAEGSWVAAAPLRALLAQLTPSEVSVLEETCGPLAGLWLESEFEGSPLTVLKRFAVDPSVLQSFTGHLDAFEAAERQREAVIAATETSPEVDDVHPHQSWLDRAGRALEEMPDGLRAYFRAWFSLFEPSVEGSVGDAIIEDVQELGERLQSVSAQATDDPLVPLLLPIPDDRLAGLLDDARKTTNPPSFFSFLDVGRHARIGRLKSFLKKSGQPSDAAGRSRLHAALDLETALRPLRADLNLACNALRVPELEGATLKRISDYQGAFNATLKAVRPLAEAVYASPWRQEAVVAAASEKDDAFLLLRRRMEGALQRAGARRTSKGALAGLEAWFEDHWLGEATNAIDTGQSTQSLVEPIRGAIPHISSYQRFRLRASALPSNALQAFSLLREWQDQLEDVERSEIDGLVRRTIKREALLAWKGRLESTTPELLFEPDELRQKVVSLSSLDNEVLALNRQILRNDVDEGNVGSLALWEDLTRLRGPRARRLREIMDEGRDLGLMRMRPIWLMSPDVASRVLPLKAGLFDVVIYDEASQMPVEFAVPTLFRAKRILIAGDEKQMPPTSFFSARMEDEEDEGSDDAFDDAITEVERIAQEETWNRREVKDCPDLLQLGRGVLPTTTLQIHYRSKYRELIDYSNRAFYRGELSIPASHPADEIRRARPIEVVRADGIYDAQTNQIEADRVVEVVAEFWKEVSPPSLGVVTFNRKQADLVEEAFERRAAADPVFLKAYRRERDRTQNGEDMGFFVKNVENVQGDERDVIVFSTTFGRDKNGAFRRVFGVLGQAGGERRLNVAVTRAREKVVLVTSMPINDISDWLTTGQASKPRDYIQAYIDYAERLSAGDLESAKASASRLGMRASSQLETSFESSEEGFIASVRTYLAELGYEASPSSSGDAFHLDFAIKDPGTGLFGIGIDCDAPRHRLLAKARAREIWRPSILQRQIPVVHRVTSQAWYHQPSEEKARLRGAIERALSGSRS